ncbi:hypothetical protein KAR28_06550 [Candidatus Parcubacteria bacterium]|nr:hypothetical protein [Candidatus Parcubacteria bacterium]
MRKTKTKYLPANARARNRSVNTNSTRWQLVNKLLLGLIAFAGIGFIITTNDIAVQGFVLAELKSDLSIIEKANAEYELTVLKLESMASINERAKSLKMVKVDNIEYVSVIDTSVAVK